MVGEHDLIIIIISQASELLKASRHFALGVVADGHGLVVGALVLDLDVGHGDAGAGDLV
jgi:hypothetical protein